MHLPLFVKHQAQQGFVVFDAALKKRKMPKRGGAIDLEEFREGA
jgi:hypothetical protein